VRRQTPEPGQPDRQLPISDQWVALLREVTALGVEYQVRAARITDVERIVALVAASAPASGAATLDAADLLRQLVYLPQASVLVAETLRTMAGVAVLALRPSVRASGYVGSIDLLVVDPRHDGDRVTGLLLDELLRSARNKGCTVVEATPPAGVPPSPAWERHGFRPADQRIERRITADRAPAGQG
jgi:GNAT superfamily N-acetyltransferase